MIDERLQDQAALYVLGALEGAEAAEFEAAYRGNAELREYVAGLSGAASAVAGLAPRMTPPPSLRARVLAQTEESQKIVALPERKPSLWIPWAIAAALALVCGVLLNQLSQLRSTLADSQRHDSQLQATVDDLNRLAQSLESTTNDLQKAFIALRESDRLKDVKIAMLNSQRADAPKMAAVTLWDDQRQSGVFVAKKLKALPTDKDYELWALDGGKTPVRAGVFHPDADGQERMDFKPAHPVKAATVFAVTEEVKGGVDSPTLSSLALMSD